MRASTRAGLLWLASTARVALAVDAVYVTDLEIYTLLAPCAADALSYNIALQTMSTRCASDDLDALQSCICTSSPVHKEVEAKVSSDARSSCGNNEDQSSAETVLSQYCNPSSTYTFSTPTENIVQAYITEISEMEYLPPCAQSALSEAVMGAGSYCPPDAALYNPCVCSKSYVMSRISSTITASVQYSCSNKEDITAAQNFYHEFCAMNDGTTSFAKPSGPPGDMTYYVTAMPHFKSLNSCAQSAVSSAIDAQTAWLCGSGPQALASCACLKSGVLSRLSSTLTSNVKWYCDNTATAQVTSALDVLTAYCAAAADETSYSIEESVSETFVVSASGSKSSGPEETGSSGNGNNNGNGNSDNQSENGNENGNNNGTDTNSDNNDDSGPPTAAIAGGVVGGVAALAILGFGIWFYRRRQSRKNGEPLGPSHGNSNPPGKPELAGGAAAAAATGYGNKELSPQYSSASPVYSSELPAGPQTSPPTELPSQQQIPRELAAGGGYEYSQQQQQQQQDGWAQYHQQHPQSSTVSPMTPPDNQGMGWQSGPVQSYELDSNMRR